MNTSCKIWGFHGNEDSNRGGDL